MQQLGTLGLQQLGTAAGARGSRQPPAAQPGLLHAVLLGLAGVLSEPVRYAPQPHICCVCRAARAASCCAAGPGWRLFRACEVCPTVSNLLCVPRSQGCFMPCCWAWLASCQRLSGVPHSLSAAVCA